MYDPRFTHEYVREPKDLDTLPKHELIALLCSVRQDKIELFNAWRLLRWQPVNLEGARLSRTSLAGINLQEALLSRTDFSFTDLSEADLQYADLTEAYMPHVYLPKADLQSARLVGAHLFKANLRDAILIEADLTSANLHAADLSDAHLRRAKLHHTSLVAAKLTCASLRMADLEQADLSDAVLVDANLTGAYLERASLDGADLENATLDLATLRDVVLSRVKSLRGVSLYHTNFWGAISLQHEQFLSGRGYSTIREHTECRYNHSVEIYKSLKGYFQDIGDSEGATWAYLHEQRMKKLMYTPRALRWVYRDLHPSDRVHLDKHCRPDFWKWLGLEISAQLAGYGVSLIKPFMWMTVLILGFAVMYRLGGMITSTPGCGYGDPHPAEGFCVPTYNPLDALIFSLGALTTMDVGAVQPYVSHVGLLMSIEALLGISLTGLIGFVLGNKLRNS